MSNEIAVVKQQVSKAVKAAEVFTVADYVDIEKGADLLKKIKVVGKLIKERMEAPIKIAYEAYKRVKLEQEKTFGEYLEGYQNAERIVKDKILAFQSQEAEKAEKAKAKLAAKVDAGTMSFEKAVEKMENIPSPLKTVEGQQGKIVTYKKKMFKVVDLSKVPLQFHLPNEVEIRKAMLGGIHLDGVEYWEVDDIRGF